MVVVGCIDPDALWDGRTWIGKTVFATENGGHNWMVEAWGSTPDTPTGPGNCLWTFWAKRRMK